LPDVFTCIHTHSVVKAQDKVCEGLQAWIEGEAANYSTNN
jgi:hypothetical protein